MNLKYYLRIFQLEGYKIARFSRWILRNHFRTNAKAKEPPVWTVKAKLLYRLAVLSLLLAVLFAAYHSLIAAAIVAVLLYFNSYLLLMFAMLLLRPYEIVNRLRVKNAIKAKVTGLKDLRVIGITGSYGKTSTKMVLQPLLPKSLMTPKSYNTMFGIYKVVDYELSVRFRFFICEMGAYKRGDVAEFCEITRPTVGILTGINEQHLERFKTIANTIRAKFEILENLRADGVGIVNLDNEHVRANLKPVPVKLIGYSVDGHSSEICDENVGITEWRIAEGKTHFSVNLAGGSHQFEMDLLGRGHLSNVLASLIAANYLGESIDDLRQRVRGLKQIPHRLECRQSEGYTLLDNSYSSNPDGFREALGVLGSFSATKVLITPGIVELGDRLELIHKELGKLAAETCDEIVLVGETQQTSSLSEGISAAGFDGSKIKKLATREEMFELLKTKVNSGEVVLIENDLPAHYV